MPRERRLANGVSPRRALSFTGNAARSSGTSTAAASGFPECMMRKRLMCQNL